MMMIEFAALQQMATWRERNWRWLISRDGDIWILACLLTPSSWRVDEEQARELLRIQRESL